MQPPARSSSSSYYAVLGVHPGASAAEIRAAYHRLAMVSCIPVDGLPSGLLWFGPPWETNTEQSMTCSIGFLPVAMQRWHPDKIASGRDPARAEEAKTRFQQIQEAYQGTVKPITSRSNLPVCASGAHAFGTLLLLANMHAPWPLPFAVLSDEKRRALYDAGMYDPLDDDQEDVEGFHDFLQEMISLMATVGREEPVYSLGELQSMLDGMIQDFAAPQPEPSGFVFAGGAEQSRSRPSARMHPQGIGDSACFTRTAFSM
ncbi:unnamed protein product [Urochloa decumbens]|uniref:J domain-containing protein n=1 Tax=Urochloa decumbens TaxID=240449 RepID=A0ABC9AFR7_9POAL